MHNKDIDDYTLTKLVRLSRIEEDEKEKRACENADTNKNKELLRIEEMRLRQIQASANFRKVEYQEEQGRLERRREEVLKQRDEIRSERKALTHNIKEVEDESEYIFNAVGEAEERISEDKRLLKQNNQLLESIEGQLLQQEKDMKALKEQELTFLDNYRRREELIKNKKNRLELEENERMQQYKKKINKIRNERKDIEAETKSEEQKMELALEKQNETISLAKKKNMEIESAIHAELKRQEKLKKKATQVNRESMRIDDYNKNESLRNQIEGRILEKRDSLNENEGHFHSTNVKHEKVLKGNSDAYIEKPIKELAKPDDEIARLDTMPGGVVNFLKDRNEIIDRGEYLEEQDELYYEEEQNVGLIGKLKKIFK